jgi:hypothetical protein
VRVVLALSGSISIHETRVVEFPASGWRYINGFVDPEFTMISVAVQELAAPVAVPPEAGVPEPISVRPIFAGGTRFDVQVQVPDGTVIISPSTALWVGPLMTAFTSLWLQDAAV